MPEVKMARSNYGGGVQCVDRIPRMDAHQHALAAEIRGEMAANRITARAMQQRAGVSSSAWNNYFVGCTRDVPMSVINDVARELGMPASELLRRAEARESTQTAPSPADVVEAALSDMSPEAQAAIRDARRHMGHDPEPEADPGRAANG